MSREKREKTAAFRTPPTTVLRRGTRGEPALKSSCGFSTTDVLGGKICCSMCACCNHILFQVYGLLLCHLHPSVECATNITHSRPFAVRCRRWQTYPDMPLYPSVREECALVLVALLQAVSSVDIHAEDVQQ